MNKYCLDIELAKELYKRGIVKDACNWWAEDTELIVVSTRDIVEDCSNLICPAPISDELMELLPEEGLCYFSIMYSGSSCSVAYDHQTRCVNFVDTKLSNALAKMILWLDDNGYLKK